MKTQPKPKNVQRPPGRRDGITIIEVLTSLLVATIGVFGVLILIPFAVQQAQIGLDQDAADLLAQNALQDLQVYGYTIVDDNGGLNIQSGGTQIDVNNPAPFHFDPLGQATDFLTGDAAFPATLNIPRATGLVSGGPMSLAEANRIFRAHDDIVIADKNFFFPALEPSDTDLPQPVFDVDGGDVVLRRQSRDRISWSAIFVPFKDTTRVGDSAALADRTPATKYKVYVLVYKDRNLSAAANPASLVTRYDSTMMTPPVDQHGGYTTAIDQIFAPVANLDPVMGPADPTASPLGKDDWVMLINRKPAPAYSAPVERLGLTQVQYGPPGNQVRLAADEPGYDVQLEFAKVASVDRVGNRITVAGGSFNFYFNDVPDTETYVVNLRNVVNVYERTISLERNSTWLN